MWHGLVIVQLQVGQNFKDPQDLKKHGLPPNHKFWIWWGMMLIYDIFWELSIYPHIYNVLLVQFIPSIGRVQSHWMQPHVCIYTRPSSQKLTTLPGYCQQLDSMLGFYRGVSCLSLESVKGLPLDQAKSLESVKEFLMEQKSQGKFKPTFRCGL